MRMVLTGDVADNPCTLDRTAIGMQMEIVVHRVEHAPLHRLESVTDVWKSPRNDHRQRIIQVAMAGFLSKRDRQNVFRHEGPFHDLNQARYRGIVPTNEAQTQIKVRLPIYP